MLRSVKILLLIIVISAPGCAFFNTFYLARKAYNNAENIIQRNKEQAAAAQTIADIPPDRFSKESLSTPQEARTFLDEAIERSNKVVVLYPKSRWAEDATLLLGKAHYYRGYSNDGFDAKNRLEVFLTRYSESEMADEARLWYGRTLLKLGQIDEAETYFLQITESTADPAITTEALIELGDMAMTDEDLSAACGFYIRATELDSRRAIRRSALYKAFFAHYRAHDYRKAVGYINILLRMDLEPAEKFDMLFMKARALKMAGEYREAIQILNDLVGNLRYKNYFIRAEFEIADALRLAGRNTEAVKQFEYVVEVYKNQLFTGDCYYFLGLINDRPVTGKDDTFRADEELARKYYYLVKTRYANAVHFALASERYEYLTKMDLFKGTIAVDEALLGVLEKKILDPAWVINIADYFPSVNDTSEQTAESMENQDNPKDKGKTDAKKEVLNVKIVNDELEEKKQQVQFSMLDLASLTDTDSLQKLRNLTFNALAKDFVLLADYFYFDLSDFDSAGHYYKYVIDHFHKSPNVEFALYGEARVRQKKEDPGYLSYYRRALERFPEGRLADVGRKALAMEDAPSDSVNLYLSMAEENMLVTGDYRKAAQQYTRAACIDSSERKLQALYSLGLLYEKKLDLKTEAFRAYNTLVFADPNSGYAKKIKPKVDAYAKEKGISGDSLKFWIDRDILKISFAGRAEVHPDTLKKPSDSTASESVKSRLPEGLRAIEKETMPSDTTMIRKTEKRKDKKPTEKSDVDTKRDENENLIPDE